MDSSLEAAEKISRRKPAGIRLIESINRRQLSFKTHQAIVLIVTFLAYASYHASRKTTSIVKSALDPQSPNLGLKFSHRRTPLEGRKSSSAAGNGWSPFNGSDGTTVLGELDLAFLGVYAGGMYFSGHLGDRMDLRLFLTIGMLGTGIFTSLFGFGYWLDVHNFYYFLIVQMLAGVFQSTGWPSVVAVVGNWFGKSKRGLIMGVWNAHTSLGNIVGSLIASSMLSYGWGWSMLLPGLMIGFFGFIVFLLLPVSPELVGVAEEEEEDDEFPSPVKEGLENEATKPLLTPETGLNPRAVGFIEAWKIPGVAPFAFCLFFAKLVAYTFLYWLPFYISHTPINGEYLSSTTAGNLSTLFDVGGVVGGILAGHISDRLNARAITAATFMYCAIPALFFYRNFGHVSLPINISLMFVAGMFINGPYALITTAVSADLGTHSSLKGNGRALATVTAIIDGTGSVGAAIGPILTGYISTQSWSAVFTMLMGAALVAGLFLTRLVVSEVASKIEELGSDRGAQPHRLDVVA